MTDSGCESVVLGDELCAASPACREDSLLCVGVCGPNGKGAIPRNGDGPQGCAGRGMAGATARHRRTNKAPKPYFLLQNTDLIRCWYGDATADLAACPPCPCAPCMRARRGGRVAGVGSAYFNILMRRSTTRSRSSSRWMALIVSSTITRMMSGLNSSLSAIRQHPSTSFSWISPSAIITSTMS